MKRFAALAAALLCLLPAVCCAAAEEDFYSTYAPKTANSSVFYINVFCKRMVTAAVFEVRYDDSMVSYYSVSAVNTTASVRDRVQNGKTTVAFADSSAVSGQLCRLSFKALRAGEVSFTLYMEQAADAERKKLPQLSSHTLTVKLGKDDIPSDRSARETRLPSDSSTDYQRGEKSYLNGADDSGDVSRGDFFDLRGNGSLKWMLLGAGITVLAASLIWIGILIGRRMQNPPPKQENPPPQEVTDEDFE